MVEDAQDAQAAQAAQAAMSSPRRIRNAESAKRARSKRKMTQSLHETIVVHAEQLAKASPESSHAKMVMECLARLQALSTRKYNQVAVPSPAPLAPKRRGKRKERAGKQRAKGSSDTSDTLAPSALDSPRECASATRCVSLHASPRSAPKQEDALLSSRFVGL